MLLEIEYRARTFEVDEEWLREIVDTVLEAEQITSADLSLVLTDDREIRSIHREFMGVDTATDVITFDFLADLGALGLVDTAETPTESAPSPDSQRVEGELIISLETAARMALEHHWRPADELCLYLVHGLLHLCGYDDLTDEARPLMREREREILATWNLVPTGLQS